MNLKNAEDEFCNDTIENGYTEETIIEHDAEHMITIGNIYIYVPQYNFDIYSGTFYNCHPNTGECEADCSVSVIRNHGDESYLYYEQDGFLNTMYNYLKAEGFSSTYKALNNLECTIINSNETPVNKNYDLTVCYAKTAKTDIKRKKNGIFNIANTIYTLRKAKGEKE